MTQTPQDALLDMRVLSKKLYDGAKLSWSVAILLKISGAGLGVIFVLLGKSSSLTAAGIVLFAVISELCQWRSDNLKGRAESLKRKIEYADGFGWLMSGKDMSDYLAKVSRRTRDSISRAVKENYFASQEQPGVKRALDNLQESAWWSKDLSGTMAAFCGAITFMLFLGALAAFIVSISTVSDFAVLQTVSRIITSVMALVISAGLLKLIVGYFNFSRKAEQIEQAVCVLLNGTPSENEAVKLLHDYQIARVSTPPIPDFIWKLRRNTLNELWQKYRCS